MALAVGRRNPPWRHRSWIFPRDPDFQTKATCVLDLYHRRWKGKQARQTRLRHLCGRKDLDPSAYPQTSHHPARPQAGDAGRARVRPRGALAYLAAWDVHQAKVHGRCELTTGIEPFGRLVEQVMTVEPYASARRVFWVVDNGSSHRDQAFLDRLQGRWRNLRLIHLPIHACWLNQVEIYFSVVQRKVLTPNDFADLAEVEQRLLAFQAHYEQIATPFEWKFTRTDLDRLPARITDHTLRSAA